MNKDFHDIPLVEQPESLNIPLYKHQLASIYQMEKLESEKMVEIGDIRKYTRLGINADQTGFGKTLSMIGLIVRDKMIWDMDYPYSIEKVENRANNLVKQITIEKYDRIYANLIVVSPSLVSQWESELKYSNLKVFSVLTKKSVESVDLYNTDVVLVIPSMYNSLVSLYRNYAWKRFIFDEPGNLRIANMKNIIAGFYWFVTATPNSIFSQYYGCRNGFMKNIVTHSNMICLDQFEGLIIKNDPEFVKLSYSIPDTEYSTYMCYQPILDVIKGVASNTVYNMISAGNIEGAISALGGKKTNNIVDLVKNTKLKELSLMKKSKRKDKNKEIDRILDQISELESRFEKMLKGNCSICIEKLSKPIMEPHCQNLFCGQCLLTWLGNSESCPLCRINIDTTELIHLAKNKVDTIIENTDEKHKTKTEKVVEIIKSNINGKFLVFSGFNNTFKPICRVLEENNIKFTQVKGTVKTRTKNINEFKYGDTNVIFLNSSFDGAGINLQEATDIILYHEVHSELRRQIIGRANRIGRKDILRVHQLNEIFKN